MDQPNSELQHGSTLDDLEAQYLPSFVDRWDDLIDWRRRAEAEGDFFTAILHRASVSRVLDVAAGTGFHSIMLAKAGFKVTAVDGSSEMLRRAVTNARTGAVDFQAIHSDWRDMGQEVGNGFDAVVCLGSSFPHLFGDTDRRDALTAFRAALKPGGLLIIDHRNFDAIRAHRYQSSGRLYYCGTGIKVSIDHIDASLCRFRYLFSDNASYTLEVYPVLKDELRDLLLDAGFAAIATYGDFKADFDLFNSDFLIHVARKR